MSSVSEMVAEKVKEVPEGKGGVTPKKMIVYITKENSELLGKLGNVTNTGKIDLGTELLRLSIIDAHRAAVKAGKMTEAGEIVGAKQPAKPEGAPANPAAPTGSPAPAPAAPVAK